MNQYIVRRTQNSPGHAQGKMNLQPRLYRPVQFENHAAGGNIAGQGGNLTFSGGKNHGQRKRKTHRATHFLPCSMRKGAGG